MVAMINPEAYTVLCFGDSNTHGLPSDNDDYERLAADVRWTGRLQLLLGDDYRVIEEGLNGRTTDVEYDDRPGCNGRPYFAPCLQTHHPLDVVVIMLGTNDLKTRFDRTPAEIADALDGYVDDVAANVATRDGTVPQIVLVSPIHIADAPLADGESLGDFDTTSIARSRLLSAEIRRVADARRVGFADAATVAGGGGDRIHFTAASHAPFAELMAETIRTALRSG